MVQDRDEDSSSPICQAQPWQTQDGREKMYEDPSYEPEQWQGSLRTCPLSRRLVRQ